MDSQLRQNTTNTSHGGVGAAASEDEMNFALSEVITLYVGPNRKQYQVHKDLLTRNSDFFRACLSCGMTEAQKNEVALPEDTTEQFDLIVRFLYTDDLGYLEPLEDNEDTLTDQATRDRDKGNIIRDAMRLYATGAKYGMPKLQDCVIDCLVKHLHTRLLYPFTLSWSFEILGKTSPLTRLLEDVLIFNMKDSPKTYDSSHKEHSDDTERALAKSYENSLKEMLANTDMSMSLMRRLTDWGLQRPLFATMVNPCFFHTHKEGDDCIAKDSKHDSVGPP